MKDLSLDNLKMGYKKTTPDLSIVKRLGGSGAAKVRNLFELCKAMRRKGRIYIESFNRC